MVRYISVQPVISTEVARKDETRYIGTFHRGTETGERIITWYIPSTVEWTVTIESAGVNTDYEQLCMDRMASPDYQTNSLYSYSPRNPEGATITNPTTTVRGKGRVYFRVGWKALLLPPIDMPELKLPTIMQMEQFQAYHLIIFIADKEKNLKDLP